MSCWRPKSSPACWRRGCWVSSGKSSTTRSGRTVRWATARRRRSRRRACGPTPQSLRRPAGTTGTVEPTLIATGPLFGGRSTRDRATKLEDAFREKIVAGLADGRMIRMKWDFKVTEARLPFNFIRSRQERRRQEATRGPAWLDPQAPDWKGQLMLFDQSPEQE